MPSLHCVKRTENHPFTVSKGAVSAVPVPRLLSRNTSAADQGLTRFDVGGFGDLALMTTLRAAVEATLLGRDERLVTKCDVPGILTVFERWDIYDVDTLSANLASSFADLQRDLAPVAALSFLGLLKATIGRETSAPPPFTPTSAPPTMPSTRAPHYSPPLNPPSPTTVPLVVTIKMNGSVLGERTTLPVSPFATHGRACERATGAPCGYPGSHANHGAEVRSRRRACEAAVLVR
jgi:hypothetical protein